MGIPNTRTFSPLLGYRIIEGRIIRVSSTTVRIPKNMPSVTFPPQLTGVAGKSPKGPFFQGFRRGILRLPTAIFCGNLLQIAFCMAVKSMHCRSSRSRFAATPAFKDASHNSFFPTIPRKI